MCFYVEDKRHKILKDFVKAYKWLEIAYIPEFELSMRSPIHSVEYGRVDYDGKSITKTANNIKRVNLSIHRYPLAGRGVIYAGYHCYLSPVLWYISPLDDIIKRLKEVGSTSITTKATIPIGSKIYINMYEGELVADYIMVSLGLYYINKEGEISWMTLSELLKTIINSDV